MGTAYRASGRSQPIFDTVGHNPYGMSSAEAPWVQHLTPSHIGEGDLDRLVRALDDAFRGTGQPVPDACPATGSSSSGACVTIWYLEAGYQTVPDPAHQQAYTGRENDAESVPDTTSGGGSTQSTQLTDGIELAYCQPYVGAFFNFLLVDEPDLARWQSGVLWTDSTRKSAYGALQRVIDEVAAGSVNCGRFHASHLGAVQPAADTLVERIEWPSLGTYSSFNQVWRFAVDARADSTFRAAVISGDRKTLTAAGVLTHERPRVVTFPSTRLAPGSYRIQITVRSRYGHRLAVTRTSPVFTVE